MCCGTRANDSLMHLDVYCATASLVTAH